MPALAMGPILFNWPADRWRDFYARVADEAPVDEVYVGEVVCAKRAPLFEPYYDEVTERLERGGKRVIRSTLAQVASAVDRKTVAAATEPGGPLIEVNDASALYHLGGRPFVCGPALNVYNEESLSFLAEQGATRVVVPPELPETAIAEMGRAAAAAGIGLETQVYGRTPLAVSARCYHARAHGRIKDNCRYVCDADPDGMMLKTLDGRPFLAVNGIQTLSYTCLNLVGELDALTRAGVSVFRLSPQSCDMVAVARVFHQVAEGRLDVEEANGRLERLWPEAPFANGFFHRLEGHRWFVPPADSDVDKRNGRSRAVYPPEASISRPSTTGATAPAQVR